MNISQQIVYHKENAPKTMNNFRDMYQVIDKNRCAELHIFQDNILVILTQHSITDGRYVIGLMKNIEQQIPLKMTLPTRDEDLFKEQCKQYIINFQNGMYKLKYKNNFKVQNYYSEQPIHAEYVTIPLFGKQQLQHRLSQKLILTNCLYKLYTLQKQGQLTNIEQLLQNGIAFVEQYAVDGRKYSEIEGVHGCSALTLDENYLLEGNKTVKYYTEYFTNSMKEMIKQNKHMALLNLSNELIEGNPQDEGYIIQGFTFSNIGDANTEYFQDGLFDFYNNFKFYPFLISWMFTYKNQLKITYRGPKEFENYNITKINTLLLDNMYDDKTILDLWNMIKDI